MGSNVQKKKKKKKVIINNNQNNNQNMSNQLSFLIPETKINKEGKQKDILSKSSLGDRTYEDLIKSAKKPRREPPVYIESKLVSYIDE